MSLRLILSIGEHIDQRQLIRHLTDLQYTRNEFELTRGAFRVRGEVLDVFLPSRIPRPCASSCSMATSSS